MWLARRSAAFDVVSGAILVDLSHLFYGYAMRGTFGLVLIIEEQFRYVNPRHTGNPLTSS